jgi:hypothetical protein
MREFDGLCLTPVHPLKPFARCLNVTTGLVA